MNKKVALVRAAPSEDSTLPMRGVLCFVDADWPLIGGAFTIGGISVEWLSKLASDVREAGPLTEAEVAAIH